LHRPIETAGIIVMWKSRKSHMAIRRLLRMWALLLRFAGLFVVALFSRPAMQAPR
jgi:hypothetical protein